PSAADAVEGPAGARDAGLRGSLEALGGLGADLDHLGDRRRAAAALMLAVEIDLGALCASARLPALDAYLIAGPFHDLPAFHEDEERRAAACGAPAMLLAPCRPDLDASAATMPAT